MNRKPFATRSPYVLAFMLLGICLFWQPRAWSANTLTRGPYLQIGTPTSIVVRWRTDTASNSRVRYGTDPANLNQAKDNSASTTEHAVTLTGLSPDTEYYYSVGDTTSVLAGGPEFTFYTAPLVGSTQPIRIWAIGDSGTANSSAAAVRNAYVTYTGTRYTDVWLMLGDNAYNDGTDSEYQAAVFNMYPTILRQTVLWPTIGNHDAHTSPPPYFQIFTLPTNGEAGGVASGGQEYYSYDYGNIHFICLDSMTSNRSSNGAMMTWLQSDIKETTQNWIIAYWHHPPYTKGSHDSDSEGELIEMRQNALPILENYGVDLVLTGHSHSYERSYLLDGHYGSSGSLTSSMIKDSGSGRADGTGAYEKTSGGTAPHEGAVYAVAGSSGKTGGGSLNHPAMYISLNNLGSMVLDVSGNRLDARFLRDNGSIGDYFTIIKGGAGTGNTPPSVSITSPVGGAAFTAPAQITISANASDNGSVSKVEFFQGSTKLGEDATSPYSYTWSNVAAGSYSLTARATDNQGATTTSAAVSVSVSSPGNTPPSVSITSPANGATFAAPAQITISANVSDNGSVSKVEFFQGSTKLGEDTTSPYSYTWSNVAAGSYSLTARATDNQGATATSTAVNVSVVEPEGAPAPPTDLRATGGRKRIYLTWIQSSAPNVMQNRVYRGVAGGTWDLIATIDAATLYTDRAVIRGVTYYYTVTAINRGGVESLTSSNMAWAQAR